MFINGLNILQNGLKFVKCPMQYLTRVRNTMSLPKEPPKPLVTFGVLTDVQYADCADRPAGYDPSKTRFYRQSLSHIEHAFKCWEKSNDAVSFALQLGDIIDGLNVSLGDSHSALAKTLSHFESNFSIPTFHTVGNHELYNFHRRELALLFEKSFAKTKALHSVVTPVDQPNNGICDSTTLYYTFCPNDHVKFISIDCFDVSVLGYDSTHPRYKKAAELLEYYHGHNDFDLWDCDGPLKGSDLRFQQMNGALGEEQLSWLEAELEDSDKKGQKVIVFGHVGLLPDSTDLSCLLWNYEDVISCFHRHHCVVAYFSGHSHIPGYACDSHGVHYVVFTGVIEVPPEVPSFATVTLHANRLEIVGHGVEKSYNLSLKYQDSCVMPSTNAEQEPIVPAGNRPVKVEV